MQADAAEYSASLKIDATSSATSSGASTVLPLLGGEAGSGKPVKLLLTLEGAFDRSDAAQVKSKNTVTIASTAVLNGSPILGLEIRQLAETTFLSLTHVPSNFLIDLTSAVGVWVKIDKKGLAEQFGSASSATATPAKKIEPAQMAQFEAAFKELRPVLVKETLKDEDIEGKASRHYRLTVDKQKLKTFVLRIQEIRGDKASLAYEKFNDDYDKFSEQVEITGLEAWIGKKDGLPTRFLLNAKASESKDVPANGTLTLDVTFKSFNVPPAIEAPADAKPIEDVIQQIMGGSAGLLGSSQHAKDAQRVSDIRQIQTALELGYSETNAYPIVVAPIALGSRTAMVLCESKQVAVWAASTGECDGTIYFGSVPSDPEIGAEYVYGGGGGSTYTIDFVTKTDAGSLSAGPQCANPNGINSLSCLSRSQDGAERPPVDHDADAGGTSVDGADAQRVSDIRQIQTALELGYSETNAYPIVPHPILLGPPAAGVLCMSKEMSAWKGAEGECDGTIYHGRIRRDPPLGDTGYLYSSPDGQRYAIHFALTSATGQLKAGPQCANQNGIESLSCDPQDNDGDGLSDVDEGKYHSDVFNADTDADGYTDGAEVAGGYDPNGPGKLVP